MTNPTEMFNQLNAASENDSLRERLRVAEDLLREARTRLTTYRKNEEYLVKRIHELEDANNELRRVVHAKRRLSRPWWAFWR